MCCNNLNINSPRCSIIIDICITSALWSMVFLFWYVLSNGTSAAAKQICLHPQIWNVGFNCDYTSTICVYVVDNQSITLCAIITANTLNNIQLQVKLVKPVNLLCQKFTNIQKIHT